MSKSPRSRLGGLFLAVALVAVPASAASERESLPPSVSPDWWSSARASIEAQEYHASWAPETPFADLEAGWQAPNRANDFRTWFTPSGVRLVPRRGETPAWEWSVSLAAWGRPGALREVAPGRISVTGNRVEVDRGDLLEWFLNDSRGLEHGFTIDTRPGGDGPLVLDLALGGTLAAALSEDGRALDFAAQGGPRVLRYAELAVRDAAGVLLGSRFETVARDGFGGIRIVVDDVGAAYPVVVDPLASSPSWSVEGNQDAAWLGASVAGVGDVNGDAYDDVLVGVPGYDGSYEDMGCVRLHLGSAAGLSTTPFWTMCGVRNPHAGDQYGSVVASAGDFNGDGYGDFAVGSPSAHDDAGDVEVWCGAPAGNPLWCWHKEGEVVGRNLGYRVATAGDVNGGGFSDLLVAEPGYDYGGSQNVGRVLLYYGSATPNESEDWIIRSATGRTDLADGAFGEGLGTAGDVNGDGYADFVYGDPLTGNVDVVYGSAAGPRDDRWVHHVGGERFGTSTLAAGDLDGNGYGDVAVGAPAAYGDDTGKVYVFRGTAAGLDHDAPWTMSGMAPEGRFGHVVGTAGDVNGDGYQDLLVTADQYDGTAADAGRAYLYYGAPGGPSLVWVQDGSGYHERLGASAATAGDVNGDGFSDVILGSPNHGEGNDGRAAVFHGGPAGLSPGASWSGEGGQAGAYFGYAVAPAGDVNADGFGDVIVGAVLFDEGETNEGKVFVYHGSATGPSSSPNWTATSDQAEARMGYSVSTAGDVNGDGFGDVLVGCRGYSNPETDEGAAFVWHGSATGLGAAGTPANADWSAEANQASSYFGVAVSTAGDIDGDGFGDIIIGASLYDDGQTDEGAAFVWHGSATGLGQGGNPSNADWSATGNQASSRFGTAVASAGDVNGDGFGDVLVGAYLYDAPDASEGKAFAWYGAESGLGAAGTPTNADWSTEGNQAGAYCGFALAGVGDLNGDTYSDVVVGSHYWDNPTTADVGRASVFYGNAYGLPAGAATVIGGTQADQRLGFSVRDAGDVNGDGYADLIIGSVGWDGATGADCGRATLYLGGAGVVSGSASWSVEGDAAADGFGYAVAGLGDVNGDGYADVIVGAPYRDHPDASEGMATIYFGNEGRGRLAKGWQYDGSADPDAIPRYGMSKASDNVRLIGRAYGLLGPAVFTTESEVRGSREAFTGATPFSSTEHPTGVHGVDFTIQRDVPSGLLHWRIRAHFTPTTSPFQSHGRWYHPVWDGWNAGSLRAFLDPDNDGVPSDRDNCPSHYNPAQADFDGDGSGDACDACTDTDGDGRANPGYPASTCGSDNCVDTPNPDQGDFDDDGTGDACDACTDSDGDGFGNSGFDANTCPDDNCPLNANPGQEDGDADEFGNVCDNCPTNANPGQEDFDHDHQGDICDWCTDTDGDGLGNPGFPRSICPPDNCPEVPSSNRADSDMDGSGDVCDDCTDQDGDGFGMPPVQLQTCPLDNCHKAYNPGQENADGDGSGDACDTCTDIDQDGWGNPGFPLNTCGEDCRPDDASIWSAPSPVLSLTVSRVPGDNLGWQPPQVPGAAAILYDVLTSTAANDWGIFAAVCVESNGTDLAASEPSAPLPGQAYYYLVRVENACGTNLGARSDETPRVGRNCP